jgi:hypothetical protein
MPFKTETYVPGNCLYVCIVMLRGVSLAQSTATLQGTIKDEKGSVVPGAKVTARNLATGIERTSPKRL